MPTAMVKKMASKSGISIKKAEKIWDTIKHSVMGAKLKSGAIVGSNPDKWKSEEWAYVTGAFKNAMKESRSISANTLIDSVLRGKSVSEVIEDVGQISIGSADVTAQFLYSGMVDYWGGGGDRWEDNKGCVFASYNQTTTNKELIDEWVGDFESGGDFEDKEPWESVTKGQVKEALIDMWGEYDDKVCSLAKELPPQDEEDYSDGESPVAIVLLTVDTEED